MLSLQLLFFFSLHAVSKDEVKFSKLEFIYFDRCLEIKYITNKINVNIANIRINCFL